MIPLTPFCLVFTAAPPNLSSQSFAPNLHTTHVARSTARRAVLSRVELWCVAVRFHSLLTTYDPRQRRYSFHSLNRLRHFRRRVFTATPPTRSHTPIVCTKLAHTTHVARSTARRAVPRRVVVCCVSVALSFHRMRSVRAAMAASALRCDTLFRFSTVTPQYVVVLLSSLPPFVKYC